MPETTEQPSNCEKPLKHSLVERLMHYYICLHTYDDSIEYDWISSKQIAAHFHIDDTQVRKDLAGIGVKGRPNAGFQRRQVLEKIKEKLKLGTEFKAVVVGIGRLGSAIVEYRNFREFGMQIVGLFDNDPQKIGNTISGRTIISVSKMKDFIKRRGAKVAILTCPVLVAQVLTYELAESGITAIWNFTPTTLVVPDGVFVRNEHISVGLGEIAYRLK